MDQLFGNFSYALRQLKKAPAFTVVAVLTLALGIGANTALFSVMSAVLLRSLPVTHPEQLFYVHIGQDQGQPDGAAQTGDNASSFSEPTFEALRTHTDVLEDLIAYAPLGFARVPIRAGAEPEAIWADEVSGNFFSGLTAPLILGHGFTPADEHNHAAVAVISYGLWTRSFNRSPRVLGATVFLKGLPFTIVGVTGPAFHGLEPGTATDLWVPLQNAPELNAWGTTSQLTLYGSPRWWCLKLFARLRPGITPAQAAAALAPAFGQSARIGLSSSNLGRWRPLLDFVPARGLGDRNESYRQPLRILMGLVVLILVLASGNVALMLLARNTVRQREFSLRLAVGAGRARLFELLFTESALLVLGGALGGWLLALYATHWLAGIAQIETGLGPDWRVLLFTGVLCAAVALVFGLAPLRSAVRAPIADVLRSGAQNLTADHRHVWRGRILMAVQVCLGLVLLTTSALLLRTLGNYQAQSLGLQQPESLFVFGLTPQGLHGPDAMDAFYRNLQQSLEALPGVTATTLAGNRPGAGWSDNNDIFLDGVHQDGVSVRSNNVGPAFAHTLGIPVLTGRDILASDDRTAPAVALVNQSFARRFYPHSSPIGHQIGSGRFRITVVGVVADSKYTAADEEPMPMTFYPVFQDTGIGNLQVILRTTAPTATVLPEVLRVVHQANPNLPLSDPTTEAQQFVRSYAEPTMFARIAEFFGLTAAVLVATGLYGTLSYRMRRRWTEIGVRMALGARRLQVLWLVLRESLLVLACGLALALPLGTFGLRLLGSMLYRLSPYDPIALTAAVGSLAAVVLLASLLPALRAASANPAHALRST